MMRNKIAFILLFCCATLFVSAQGQWFVDAELSGLFTANPEFGALYGELTLHPRLSAGLRLSKLLFVWTGGSFFSRFAEIAELGEECRYRQLDLGIGCGISIDLTERLKLDLSEGFMWIRYKEEALGLQNKQSAFGIQLGLKLRFCLGRSLYLLHSLSHTFARDSFEDLKYALGGVRVGLGLGFRF